MPYVPGLGSGSLPSSWGSSGVAGGGRVDTQALIAASKAQMAARTPAPAPTTKPTTTTQTTPAPKPTSGTSRAMSSGMVLPGRPGSTPTPAPKPAAAAPTPSAFGPSPTPQPSAPSFNFNYTPSSYTPQEAPPAFPVPPLPNASEIPRPEAPPAPGTPAIQALQASETEPLPENWSTLASPSEVRPGLGQRLPFQLQPQIRAVAY